MQHIRLFHCTTSEAATAITAAGFIDHSSHGQPNGVWVSAYPLTANEGARGEACIEIVIESTPEEMFYQWEVIESDKPYREWCIPAAVLNRFQFRIISPEELANLWTSREYWNEYPPGEPERTLAELEEGDLE